jgi:RNA polymerase sigma-70 factor (ECF subfamily)
MVNDSDITLVEKSLSGDPSAFEEIVRRHATFVGGIAYNILGDVEKARDVVQETFLKVFKSLPTLRDPAKFRSWLAWIARTTCVDVLRKEHVRPVSLVSVNLEPACSEAAPTASLEREELYEKVLAVLNSLPRIYRDIIMMRHLHKKSYKSIAQDLGISDATVESRLYRAKLLLKDKMKDLY